MQSTQIDPRESLQKAIQALKGKQPHIAEQICREFLVHTPSSMPHIQLLSHALIQTDRYDEAESQLEFAIKIVPDYANLYEDLGSLYMLQGRTDEGIRLLEQAVQMNPQLSSAHKKLGTALAQQGETEAADEAFEAYIDQDPQRKLVAQAMGHWRAGRNSDAISTLRQVLMADNNNVDAMRFLAIIYINDGNNLYDAEALLRRATEIAPDYVQALNDLGSLLNDSHKYDEAVSVWNRVIALTPDDKRAYSSIGSSLTRLGRLDEAVANYKKALQIDEASPQIHMVLAHQLKTLGRQEEALVSYRRSIELNPGLGESYWSMANLKIFKFEPNEVAAMEAQLEKEDISKDARFHLLFSLGKAYEDLKDYKKAWHYYDEGNKIRRETVSYDPTRNRVECETDKTFFNQAFIDQHKGSGHDAKDPIFIVGLPRTGSTLIEQILASHSQVEGTSELPNIGAIAQSTAKFRRDNLQYPQTLENAQGRDWRAYGRQYLKEVAHHRIEGTPIFIDKMPNNFFRIGFIKLILPNAKIINTRRYPLDSLLGAYKQLFARGQDFTYDRFELSEYYRDYVDLMNHWHSVFPGEILDVHYEDTVTDFETQVKRILEFCDLPFEENCLRFHETKRAVKTASSEQVRQPIYRGALGLFKKYDDEAMQEWKDDLEDIIEALPQSVKDAVQ